MNLQIRLKWMSKVREEGHCPAYFLATRFYFHWEKWEKVFPVLEKAGNLKLLPESQVISGQSGKSEGKITSENKNYILHGKYKNNSFYTYISYN